MPQLLHRLCLHVTLGLTVGGCAAAERRTDTVLYASGAELQSINPLVTTHPMAKQVQKFVLFTTLVRYDEALRPTPYLATSWKWSGDRRTVTMQLSPEARWHDGVPTTARDVVWTLEAARDPATGYPRIADLARLESVAAIDTLTVEFGFATPQPRMPDVLTDLAILPAHYLETVPHADVRTAGFNQAPVGNGPFRFVRHAANRRWVFERNEQFPTALGGPPRLKRFVVAIVDEPTTKLAALAARELDVAGINAAHAEFVRRIPYLDVRDYPLIFTYMLIFNMRRPPFDDPTIRRAVALALDRESIVEAYIYGFGSPAWGPVPPDHPAAIPTRKQVHAPDSARQLLAHRGYDTQNPLEFELLTVATGENPLEQMIQAQLARVGIVVRLRAIELGAFLARAQSERRDFDGLVTGIPGDLALSHLRGLFDSRRIHEPLQYAGYRNPAVDESLDANRWDLVQELVAEDQPIVFLYHARGVQGVSRRLAGAVMDLRGELPTVVQWYLVGENDE